MSGVNSLREFILDYIELSDLEWEYCSKAFELQSIKKKEVVLMEGAVCRSIFFVVKGLLRIYFIDQNGEEKTFHFSVENTFATEYESFLKHIPSSYFIQALEDTVVVTITFEMLQDFYKKLKNGEKLGRLIAEEYFFLVNDKIRALYTQTPIERYKTMNEKFQNILQRVPQRYIASYLNISPVHLSRLKRTG